MPRKMSDRARLRKKLLEKEPRLETDYCANKELNRLIAGVCECYKLFQDEWETVMAVVRER